MYNVIDPAGQTYGPVSRPDLDKWHAEGRVAMNATIVEIATGTAIPAAQFFAAPAPAVPAAPAAPAAPAQAMPPQTVAPPNASQPGYYARPPDNFFAYQPLANGMVEADLGTRFIGALIDGLIFLPLGILWRFMPFFFIFIYFPLMAIYWMTRDMFMGPGVSIGKKVMKTRAVREDGQPFTFTDSIMRNISHAIYLLGIIPVLGWLVMGPIGGVVMVIEIVMVVMTRQRIGDKIQHTRVVMG